jgi:hypothetical protein
VTLPREHENASDDSIRQGMVEQSTIDERVRVVVTLIYYLERRSKASDRSHPHTGGSRAR